MYMPTIYHTQFLQNIDLLALISEMIDSETFLQGQQNEQPPQKQQKTYKKIKLLGSGSYAKAYLVQEISTSNLYVIKQINISDMTNDQQKDVKQEARILQLLDHPNIIKFKQIHLSKVKLNIVMEYADGGDLAQKIKEAKQKNMHFQQDLILNWFTQICLGMKHIHDRKIIHRDLKGQNIFLTSDNCVKIGDLGVAKILEHTVSKAKTVIGTPYYMSPQVIENRPYQLKTDIWSLGTLLYQMCALVPPFTANNIQFLALKIVRGNYSLIPQQYSSDLKALIKSMLNTNPKLRPNINQILSSPLIHKRIKSLLSQSRNQKEFSHSNMHKCNQAKNQVSEKLRPPPNLIQIQQESQNLSAVIEARKLYEEAEVKAKTPLCIGKNAPPIKKKILPNNKIVKPNTAQDLSDLMKIKATQLEQHVIPVKPQQKFVPISMKKIAKQNPQVFDYQCEKISPQQSQIRPNAQKQIKKAIPSKKKSIDCVQYNKMQKNQDRKQTMAINARKIGEQKIEGKEKACKIKQQRIECVSARQNKNISNQIYGHGLKQQEQQFNNQPSALNQKKSEVRAPKPVSAKLKKAKQVKPKQKKNQKQTKLQLVSEQMQKKQKSQKQQKKIIKKPLSSKKKLNVNITRQSNKQTQIIEQRDQEIVQQQKYNEDNQEYQDQQFQVYQQIQQQTQNENEEDDPDFSFALSNSSSTDIKQIKNQAVQQKPSYQKMLAQLEIVKKLVDEAKNNTQDLPIIGVSLTQLLQLSKSNEQSGTILFQTDKGETSEPLKPNFSNSKSLVNLACISDQSQLQNLRMALQQIFQVENILKIYKMMGQVVEKYGLQFNEEDTLRSILKECPEVQQTCLRRHFRLIVTVIVIENQLVQENLQKH